ncbi:MAG: ParB N-terminal domain-containing protein [Candidatus Heimdallarchaeota archaeon]
MKSSFSHKRPLVKQRIVLLRLDKLLPHEQIVNSHVDFLKDSLSKTKLFIRPIVVAKGYNVILDGHHRVAALQELGYRKIPCVQIPNYLKTDKIVLGTWYPVYKGNSITNNTLLEGFVTENIEWKEVTDFDPSLLLEPEVAFILVTRTNFFQLFGDQKALYNNFLDQCDPKTIDYVKTIDYAVEAVKKGKGRFALLRKALTREDVIEITKNHNVYAPKTTRHILSFRYQDIRVPLEKLK